MKKQQTENNAFLWFKKKIFFNKSVAPLSCVVYLDTGLPNLGIIFICRNRILIILDKLIVENRQLC